MTARPPRPPPPRLAATRPDAFSPPAPPPRRSAPPPAYPIGAARGQPVISGPTLQSAGVAALGPPAGVPPQPRPSVPRSAAPDPEDHVLPQTFFVGRYRVVDEIGVGGMASVHLARVDGPGGFQKWVAIKRIHPHLVEDDQFVDMFLDEARIAAGINHANVAQVFDLGKDDNTYWIAMEYLHGEPLREVMRRVEELGATVPFHIATRICADAAEGLHGAHELRGRNGQLLNLVHRDVTPHNLFVTYDGYTKVVDFGIAKVIDRLASTRAGTLKGKLAYMSPEQVRGQEVDRRTDVFALGVVLWELTTNRRLFRMETDLDTLEKVQACVVPLPTTLVAGYPAELEQVVMKALSQRREDRFQTAREFSRALQASLMRQGLMVGPEDVGEYLKQLFQDRVKKREKYLEWAAEVTGAVDLNQLQAQADAGGASLLTGPSASQVQERHSKERASAPPPRHVSGGRDVAAAQVVTSAPARPQLQRASQPPRRSAPPPGMAQSSLMDEDEEIATTVSAEAHGGAPEWGGATQMIPQEQAHHFESTIALPDAQVPPRAGASGYAPLAPAPPAQAQPYYAQGFAQPGAQQPMQQQAFGAQQLPTDPSLQRPNQAVIETKMSMPRPAAVAQFLAESGDISMPTPRSTPILVAIALLATLCAMGVAALVVFKLQRTPVPLDPTAPVTVAASDGKHKPTAPGSSPQSATTAAGKASEPEAKPTSAESAAAPAGSEKPGTLSLNCTPACDQVVADGRSLGPSPVNAGLPAGVKHITCKRGGASKTIAVEIKPGQLTTASCSM